MGNPVLCLHIEENASYYHLETVEAQIAIVDCERLAASSKSIDPKRFKSFNNLLDFLWQILRVFKYSHALDKNSFNLLSLKRICVISLQFVKYEIVPGTLFLQTHRLC